MTHPSQMKKAAKVACNDNVKLMKNCVLSYILHVIKNPASQEIKDGVTWKLARTRERDFFESTAPWATLDWHYGQKLGTDKLTARLGKSLTGLIVRRYVL